MKTASLFLVNALIGKVSFSTGLVRFPDKSGLEVFRQASLVPKPNRQKDDA